MHSTCYAGYFLCRTKRWSVYEEEKLLAILNNLASLSGSRDVMSTKQRLLRRHLHVRKVGCRWWHNYVVTNIYALQIVYNMFIVFLPIAYLPSLALAFTVCIWRYVKYLTMLPGEALAR